MAAATATMVDHALAYAALGWAVFPVHSMRDERCTCGRPDCTSQAKHPMTKHGVHDATLDVDRITAWWKAKPKANVAVAAGAISGIVVLDVDGMAGEQTLAELEEQYGHLPDTVKAITGGDGQHIVFRHPGAGIEISNTAGARGKLGAGLDFRGDGGYVVVAPSLHHSGRRYDWLYGPETVEPAPLPAWLLERLRAPVRRPAPPAPAPVAVGGQTSAYALKALDSELAELGAAKPGDRNHALNRAAFNLGQLVAGGELGEGLVVQRLTEVASAIGLGGTEVPGTIASGMGKGRQEPRTAPPRDSPPPSRPNLTVVGAGSPDGPGPEVKNDEPPPRFEVTDMGNAKRLVFHHGRDLHYAPATGGWLIWDGRRWRRDGTGEIYRRAKDVVNRILREAGEAESESRAKELNGHWLKSQSERALRAMVIVAQSEEGIPVEAADIDADPWLFNCRNGVIDLKTGELLAHDRKRLITKISLVAYDPDARLPMWDRFLAEATAGDEAVLAFLHRSAGYSLTGDTSEEVLFFTHGPTGTGKSTYLDALRAAWGEYATTADFETFLQQQGAGPRNDIARLAGARLVVSIEMDEGKRLAEGLVKTITGGDTVTARFLYRESFEFRPAFKLWLAANDAPRVNHDDEAMWRRILRVPFEHQVSKDRRDPAIKSTLRDPFRAGPAILAWAVQGCLEWQRRGIGVPRAIEAATEAYRDDQDELRDFIEDRCVVREDTWALAGRLYAAYREWAKEAGLRFPVTQQSFGRKLAKRGYGRQKVKVDGASAWRWKGINLAESYTSPADDLLSDPRVPEPEAPVPDVDNYREPPPDLGEQGPGSRRPPFLPQLTSYTREEVYENSPPKGISGTAGPAAEPAGSAPEATVCAVCGGPKWITDHSERALCRDHGKRVAAFMQEHDRLPTDAELLQLSGPS